MKRITALIAVAMLTGCTSQTLPGRQYVAADRQTLAAVKPFLADHAASNPDDAAALEFVVRSWDSRVTAAEDAYAEQGQ